MNVYPVQSGDEALALAAKGARVMAGCTNLFVERKTAGFGEADFVDISGVSEWKTIGKEGGKLRLGALVTFDDILRQLDPRSALYEAAYVMGSPQIRNRATLGGNLCDASPACDAAPALLVLDAKIELRSVRGSREVAISDFFRGYRQTEKKADEILTGITLPLPAGKSVFRKIGLRNAMAISVVSLAAAKSETGFRLAMGSVAETPVRLLHCEQSIGAGKLAGDALRAALEADIRPVSDLRASAEYRFESALALLCDVLGKEYGYEIG